MADRKPLVLVSGGMQELSAADNLQIPGTMSVEKQLILGIPPTPLTPIAGTVQVYAKTLASRHLNATKDPHGIEFVLQPSMWRQRVGSWSPSGNSASNPGTLSMLFPTAVGTATARAVATTNKFTRMKRLGWVSSATAGSLCGHYTTAAQHTVGDGAGLGGFFYAVRFGISDAATVAGARMFIGLSSTTSVPTNVDPSTIINCIGLAKLSTDSTQLYLVYGGSAAQADIALGTNFPPDINEPYELTLYSPTDVQGVVYYRVERLGTSFIAEGTLGPGTLGTTLPSSTSLLCHRAWRCNNATALACGLDVCMVYMETED